MERSPLGGMPDRQANRLSGCRSVAWLMMLLIFGIPSVIAFRAYRVVQVRAQVAEGAALALRARDAVAFFHARNRAWPQDNAEADLAAPAAMKGEFVGSVTVAGARVTVRFGNQADARIGGRVLVYAARPQGLQLLWTCTSAAGTNVDAAYRPSACRP